MTGLTRDGTAEPITRDQILRRERGQDYFFFSSLADHEHNCQPYPLDPYPPESAHHKYIYHVADARALFPPSPSPLSSPLPCPLLPPVPVPAPVPLSAAALASVSVPTPASTPVTILLTALNPVSLTVPVRSFPPLGPGPSLGTIQTCTGIAPCKRSCWLPASVISCLQRWCCVRNESACC